MSSSNELQQAPSTDSDVDIDVDVDVDANDQQLQPGGDTTHMDISVRSCMVEFKTKGKQAAIDRAFIELDLKQNGQLDKSEITAFMEQAAKVIKLEVSHSVIEDAVEALLDDVGCSNKVITKEQFDHIFERHPDLFRCFDDEVSVVTRKRRQSEKDELKEEEADNLEAWIHAHTQWKSQKVFWVWLALYIAANVTAFAYKGYVYANDEEAQTVFGSCIIVARGSAQCLNLNCCLILLPMCRQLLTRVRAVQWLRFLFPFDASLEVHIYLGIAIAIFATIHVSAHICDFHRFARADEDDIFALFGTKLGTEIPTGIGERWLLLLSQPAGITGVIMVVSMLIAYPMTRRRHTHFNTFWGTHHLLLVMLVALCFHGIGSLLEPFQSVYWVMVPLAAYLIPRFWRETPLSQCKVLDVQIKNGGVVGLKLERPKSWKNNVKAGMYAFINVPQVSRLQWHPFTLTSAPCEDFVEFHFKRAGDWTGSVHDLLEDLAPRQDEEGETTDDQVKAHSLSVKLEGPIGASSQGFSDYPIVVLIGAGIGVTPMISVVKQLLKTPGKMKRTYLYWTIRDRASFDWFTNLMDEIFDTDQKHVIQIRHFLTSVKEDDRDIGAVLLHHATRAKHHKTNFDILLGQYAHHQVEVGRPDWKEEFEAVRSDAKELGHDDCGIFLCGPERMATAVSDVSFELSKKDPKFHFYFSKETF